MNKIGIYYAYWTRNWDADFVPFVSKVKGLGFDILEVNAGTVANMPDAELARLRATALAEGIELTACIGLTKDYDIACDDAAVRRNGVEFLKQQARALHKVGIKTLGGILYSSWPGKLPGTTDKQSSLERSVASMREAIKVAEDSEVTFNMEVVNRFEQYLLNTAEEAVRYVEMVGSENCKILLDTFHMNIEEDSFRGAIVTAGDKLGHVHLGETNRRAPGRGKMAWDEIFGALREIDYRGAIVMEPFLQPGGEVGRDISVYRDLSVGVDLDTEAARAALFVRDRLANVEATIR